MNRTISAIAAVIAAAACAFPASAQELNSEFTVTHQVVPEERAATRLHLLPVITLPSVNAGRLPAATLANAAPLTPVSLSLEPAPWQTSISSWPWRGYASLAYGPVYNLDASAGYSLLRSDVASVGAFMQFNGFNYSSKHPDRAYRVYGPQRLHRNSLTAGLRSEWKPVRRGVLTASADYSFSAYNIPMPVVDKTLTPPGPFADPELCVLDRKFVNHNGVSLAADWRHAVTSRVSYTVAASYGLAAFSRLTDGATENRGSLGASLRYDHGRRSHWLVGLDASLIGLSDYGHKGVISFTPSYLLTLSHFSAQIGVRIDWLLGNIPRLTDSADGWIYPEVKLNWRPSSKFDLWGRADGRTDLNSMASLFEAQPYNYPVPFAADNLAIGTSQLYNFEAGMTIGPWFGASISLFGGVHMANKWLMPALRTGYWDAVDVSGAHYGFALDYSYRRYITLGARMELASSPDGDFTVGYYPWRDHARMDLNLSASSRPIQPLMIAVDYHLRTHRAKPLPAGFSQNLGSICDFGASVAYDVTPQWSVSLRGENLFNHIYYLGPAIPSQGLRIMAGVSYKF